MMTIVPNQIQGLPIEEQARFAELLKVFSEHQAKNQEKERYYEGKVSLREVNLGLALPDGIARLEIGCSWGAKTVDVLAGLSMFDGFVGMDGNDAADLDQLVIDNKLIGEYAKACRDELKYGCTFATLSADEEIGCKIRFHSPQTAAALWNGEKGRMDCGFAIIDTMPDNDRYDYQPSLINYYTDDAIWVFRRNGTIWTAEAHPHQMHRPMMEALVWNATSNKPFGRSRIKEPIRRLIQGYVRTIANATIGLEFATSPQKYLLGVTDEQYDVIINQKFKQYVGSILAGTANPETGEKPSFGQLQQGNISPHVEMIRILATQFSAASGLTVTDTGVVNDANPSSAEAVIAQSRTLTGMAEQLNVGNGDALRNIAIMALAIKKSMSIDELTDPQKDVFAHFKNPSMPSVAVTADAAIKIAGVRENFGQTDIFLEMIGFDKADIRRINAQERRVRGMAVLEEMEEEEEEEFEEEDLGIELEEEEEEIVEEDEEEDTSDLDEITGMLEDLLKELG